MANVFRVEALGEHPEDRGESNAAKFPKIFNKTLTAANTEYSIELPENTRKYLVHTRDESAFRLAFEPGKVAGSVEPFFTVLANTRYWEDLIQAIDVKEKAVTLYFATAALGSIIELVAWV